MGVPEGLQALVDSMTYKPRWRMYIEPPDEECPVARFYVVSRTEDSYDPGKTIGVIHEFMVPPASYDEKNWKAWLVDRLGDVEMHERNEFVKFDGKREFAPHHGNGEDPYRTWMIGSFRAGSQEGRAGLMSNRKRPTMPGSVHDPLPWDTRLDAMHMTPDGKGICNDVVLTHKTAAPS